VELLGPPGGRPLLMLHGWGSSAELMRPAAAGLDGQFRIHNVDLPGHGRTPPPPEAWGVPEFAELVEAYLAAQDLSRIPVIGHSNGGRIALFMASEERYRHRFSKLVLIAPSGVRPRRPLSYYIKTGWIATIKAPFAVVPPPLRQRGLAWLRTTIYWRLAASRDYQEASGVMRETFVKTVRFFADDRLSSIRQPTLIFWGDQDPSISQYQIEALERDIPDAGVVVLEGAGHYAHLDDPVTYQQAVRHFLTEDET
jgi:pimeloyl-ACP methyl ester carboxylesterase